MTKERFRVMGKITRLLGSESVSDKATALFEILKNSHDADAQSTKIKFYDFDTNTPKISIIETEGNGMSYDEIKNNFLVIGTYSKEPDHGMVLRTKRKNRIMVGRKGVGRFALEKLGKKVKIISKPFGTSDKFSFEIDWGKFELENVTVDDVSIEIHDEKRDENEDSGLEIIISNLNDIWDKKSIERFMESVRRFILPEQLQPRNPFKVFLECSYFGISSQQIISKLEEKAFFELDATLHKNEVVIVTKKLGKNYKTWKFQKIDSWYEKKEKEVSDLQCGPAILHVNYYPKYRENDKLKKYYYDEAKNHYGEDFFLHLDDIMDANHGVRIIKDNVREFSYGDPGFDWTERAWISRMYSGTTQADKILGFCFISSENNSKINPTTNRREAVDNQAFRDLKDFVIFSMMRLDSKISNDRRELLKKFEEDVKPTSINLQKLETAISKPKVSKALRKLEEELDVELNIVPIIKEARKIAVKKEEGYDEIITKDDMTLANAGLGEYFADNYHFLEIGKDNHSDSINNLRRFSKRKEVHDDIDFQNMSHGLSDSWELIHEGIEIMGELTKGLAVKEYHRRKNRIIKLKEEFEKGVERIKKFYDFDDFQFNSTISPHLELKIFGPVIFQIIYNLLSNSIKIFDKQEKGDKRGNNILVQTRFDKKTKDLILFYSDNSSYGVEKERWDLVFERGISTTVEHKEHPGRGLGLPIIKRMLGYVNGSIRIIQPHYGKGTTFKITIPYKYIKD